MRKAIYSPEYQLVRELFIELREGAGLTQREMADKLKRAYSMVWRVETGQRRVDILEFYWICGVLGVDARVTYSRLIDRIEAASADGGKQMKQAAERRARYKIPRPAK